MSDPTQILRELSPLKAMVEAEIASKKKPAKIPCGNYTIFGDGGFIEIHRTPAAFEDDETKWKLHVSIAPRNLDKAWGLYAELVIRHEISSFKVCDRANPGNGKQITIYCRMRDKDELLSFLRELEESFKQNNIVPDSAMPEDCSAVSGSRYISFRYETFDYSLSKPSIRGAPENYISDTHVDFAKEMLGEMQARGEDNDFDVSFNQAYNSVLERNTETPEKNKPLWFRKYQHYKKNRRIRSRNI